jgi:hypothetical protein
MERQTEGLHPWGPISPLWDKVLPLGSTSPQGTKFFPSGELKTRPQAFLFEMAYMKNAHFGETQTFEF